MIELANIDDCTGCSACSFVCPKSCIKMTEGKDGILLPNIDHKLCIQCHKCQNTCPVLSPPLYNKPLKAYAAWSKDKKERLTSASGGIAAEIYKETVDKQHKAIGAKQEDDFKVRLALSDNYEEIKPFKNSKYVFSYTDDIYDKIRKELIAGNSITIIALPCQIAAVRKIFSKYLNQLLLVDVVCHGVTPFEFLKQHICKLESQKKQHAVKMSFRDPYTYTYTYTFTLYNEKGERFYAKRTKEGDSYQYGYHRNLSYRENCYHCRFARRERISDITLNDYKNIGKYAPSKFTTEHNLSSIIVNTTKGEDAVVQLIKNGKIDAEERPLKEPLEADGSLNHPTPKKAARFAFEKYLLKYDYDFEKTMKKVIILDKKKEYVKLICSILNKLRRNQK